MKKRRSMTVAGVRLEPLWLGGYRARIAGRLVLLLATPRGAWRSVLLAPYPRRAVLAQSLRGCILDTVARLERT